MLEIDDLIRIPLDELEFQFVRSGGPGGQNVNKVATKAVLRWDVSASPSVPEPVRARFLTLHANRINNDGELVLSSERHRSQARNAEACRERLRALVVAAVPAPKVRRTRRPSKAAKRRRLEAKRRQAAKKRGRGRVAEDE